MLYIFIYALINISIVDNYVFKQIVRVKIAPSNKFSILVILSFSAYVEIWLIKKEFGF